jgi:pimeloyl-ACP methyl ester carboxylesterase
MGELGLQRPVIAGYDIGSRTAQAIARARPDLVITAGRRAVIKSPLRCAAVMVPSLRPYVYAPARFRGTSGSAAVGDLSSIAGLVAGVRWECGWRKLVSQAAGATFTSRVRVSASVS